MTKKAYPKGAKPKQGEDPQKITVRIEAGVWTSLPPKPTIESSLVEFTNGTDEYDMKVEFSSGLISPNSIEIPPKGAVIVNVQNGKEDNDLTVWTRTSSPEGTWEKRDPTGDGPEMDIDNP